MNVHRRHDLSDQTWALLEPHLPGRAGAWGGNARDNRLFINAVLWILRTGAPWRDYPKKSPRTAGLRLDFIQVEALG